jgi:hypothetical protein
MMRKMGLAERLHQLKNNPNAYIRFTDVPKLGINPAYEYNTPAGLHFYPIKGIWQALNGHSNLHAINLPYAHICVMPDDLPGVLQLDQYTKARLLEDIEKLFDLMRPIFNPSCTDISNQFNDDEDDDNSSEVPSLHYLSPLWKPGIAERYMWQQFVSEAIKGAIRSTAPVVFWNLTRRAAILSLRVKSGTISSRWNKIFRQLGYNGFRDSGLGVIHQNEPCQAVILNSNLLLPYREMYTRTSTRPAAILPKSTTWEKRKISFAQSLNPAVIPSISTNWRNDPRYWWQMFMEACQIYETGKGRQHSVDNLPAYRADFAPYFKDEPDDDSIKVVRNKAKKKERSRRPSDRASDNVYSLLKAISDSSNNTKPENRTKLLLSMTKRDLKNLAAMPNVMRMLHNAEDDTMKPIEYVYRIFFSLQNTIVVAYLNDCKIEHLVVRNQPNKIADMIIDAHCVMADLVRGVFQSKYYRKLTEFLTYGLIYNAEKSISLNGDEWILSNTFDSISRRLLEPSFWQYVLTKQRLPENCLLICELVREQVCFDDGGNTRLNTEDVNNEIKSTSATKYKGPTPTPAPKRRWENKREQVKFASIRTVTLGDFLTDQLILAKSRTMYDSIQLAVSEGKVEPALLTTYGFPIYLSQLIGTNKQETWDNIAKFRLHDTKWLSPEIMPDIDAMLVGFISCLLTSDSEFVPGKRPFQLEYFTIVKDRSKVTTNQGLLPRNLNMVPNINKVVAEYVKEYSNPDDDDDDDDDDDHLSTVKKRSPRKLKKGE